MTTARMRPCTLVWSLAFAGMLMTTTPVAAELPVAVLYDMTDGMALPGSQTPDRVAHVALAMPTDAADQSAERVADSEIHLP